MKRTLTIVLLILFANYAPAAADEPQQAPVQANPSVSKPQHEGQAHDPAHPPIDCPLRRQGIDPHGLKPFDDVEKYIQFLEREDRALWQKPDDVVASLGLAGDETLFDLGAGSGYFTFRFARALPRGEVVASDIELEMLRHIHHKAMLENVPNIRVQPAQPDDPTVPTTADWVFICDVLHHVSNRANWLKHMHGQMKPGGRVALIEFKEGTLPEGPPESLKISQEEMIGLMTTAGFRLVEEKSQLLPYQLFLIFQKE
jgi:ubiquinone/menaquinone biosynthesis C-methylase UbiE